jgi:hypothetical protein
MEIALKQIVTKGDFMNKNILFFLILSVSSIAHANWFCSEESSDKIGNVINACGVAEASTESKARSDAFESASQEYKHLCEASDDCRYHFVNVKPKRTSCEKTASGFKCYRMLAYEIGDFSKSKASDISIHTGEHVKTLGESYATFKVN